MSAYTGSDPILGKSVSDLQTGVAFSDVAEQGHNIMGTASGTLKSVSGYTGYSDAVSEQSGHYIAVHVDGVESAKACVSASGNVYNLTEDTEIDSTKTYYVRPNETAYAAYFEELEEHGNAWPDTNHVRFSPWTTDNERDAERSIVDDPIHESDEFVAVDNPPYIEDGQGTHIMSPLYDYYEEINTWSGQYPSVPRTASDGNVVVRVPTELELIEDAELDEGGGVGLHNISVSLRVTAKVPDDSTNYIFSYDLADMTLQ